MNDIVATNTGTFQKAHYKQRKRRQKKNLMSKTTAYPARAL